MTEPLVSPFRAERFADLASLGDLIAPPYDVITPTERASLSDRHEHNIVHLILPHADEGDPYEHAAHMLDQWREEGVIVPDGDPAVYVMRQAFMAPDGTRRERTGVIGAVAVEPFQGGRVKPHERTHRGPKEDRLALLNATGTMFESLFMFARDEGGKLAGLLAEAARRKPMMQAELGGVTITVWRTTKADATTLAQMAGSGPLYMADGHHRYETAVSYRGAVPAADRVPALIVPVSDPGLIVLPTHRLVRGGEIDWKKAVERLRERFQIRELDKGANYLEELAAMKARGTATVVVAGGGKAVALLLKGGASLGDVPFANEPAVSSLDVARIDSLVVDVLKDVTADAQVGYSPDAHYVIDAVQDGDAQVGVLLNPTLVDQVLRVADAGAVMPPKSTYFIPKVPSGVIMMPLGGAGP